MQSAMTAMTARVLVKPFNILLVSETGPQIQSNYVYRMQLLNRNQMHDRTTYREGKNPNIRISETLQTNKTRKI